MIRVTSLATVVCLQGYMLQRFLTFHLGRRDAGDEAVLLLSVDTAIPNALLTTIRALPGVKVASALRFV